MSAGTGQSRALGRADTICRRSGLVRPDNRQKLRKNIQAERLGFDWPALASQRTARAPAEEPD